MIVYLHMEYWTTTPQEREELIKIFERNDQKNMLQQYESLLEKNEVS